MAAYRFSAQVIGRSSGRVSTNAAAYRSASRLVDERTGQTFDYSHKGGILLSEILAPDHAPADMRDRSKLWNAVERGEKRKDAQLARELLLNIPHELTREQGIELVRGFIHAEFVALGMVADLNIHAPDRKGDERNTHAHVMLTMRSVTAEGFGAKVREWNDPAMLDRWREQWAIHQNRALEKSGCAERVDHRSLEAQGIDREPEPKQGPVATQMERQGKPSKAGDDRRATKARNAEREELKAEGQVIDLALARQERQEAARRAAESKAANEKIAARQAAQREAASRHAADRLGQIEAARQQADQRAQQQNARRIERERDRFSGWANARRAEAQSARHDAETSLGRDHQRERLALDNRHEATRPQREQQQAALDAITQRQQRGGLLYRLTGRAGKDEAQATAIKATMRDRSNRQAEERQALNVRHEAERKALAQQHGRQDSQLEQRIDRARDRREREGWQDQRGKQQDNAAAEAENRPVEAAKDSRDAHKPEPAEAAHAPDAAKSDDPASWSKEERAAKVAEQIEVIRAARLEREANERGHDTGRTMSR